MPVRSRDHGEDHLQVEERPRRFGRLAPASGGAAGVRCACDTCGAHLMGLPAGEDRYRGVCLVCGGEQVTPV